MRTIIEPFRIRMVEPIRMTTRAEREAALRAAGYNMFRLRSRDVIVDLLTDSGTGAMSTEQWAALMRADEAYAGGESFYELEAVVRDLTGYRHVFPVHQGRAAERIVFSILGGPGRTIPSNAHFDTTRANIEFTGAEALDLPVPAALDPGAEDRFKGNLDVERLRALLESERGKDVPVGMLTVTNNAVGGQAVSLANVREVAELYHAHGVPFLLDAARFAENAWLIKRYESGQQDRPLIDIVREMFSYADGCLMSTKKDGLVNIGGLLAVNDDDLAEQIRNLLILTEGFPTYGGLAGRDLAAMAVGLREVLDEDYLAYREASVRYLAEGLDRLGVPRVRPSGLHAVYVDAKGFLPHVSPERLPGQSLCCELYLVGGVRSVEIGTLMFGREDPETGAVRTAPLELVRLCLPRRVYTQSHVDWVLEAFEDVAGRRERLGGYEIVEQARVLRAFTAVLRPCSRTTSENQPRGENPERGRELQGGRKRGAGAAVGLGGGPAPGAERRAGAPAPHGNGREPRPD